MGGAASRPVWCTCMSMKKRKKTREYEATHPETKLVKLFFSVAFRPLPNCASLFAARLGKGPKMTFKNNFGFFVV